MLGWRARREMGPSLPAIMQKLKTLAEALRHLGCPLIADELDDMAGYLEDRHDHADPCEDEACPCRKAEADHWRDQGHGRP